MAEASVVRGFRGGEGRGWARPAIRIAGLILFTAYLFAGPLDAPATLAGLRGIEPEFWLLAWAVNLAPPLLIARRLQGLLAERGYAVAYGRLARDSLRSMALNTVAIMGAGDLYRVNGLRAAGVPVLVGSPVVVIDRALGVCTLIALVAVFPVLGPVFGPLVFGAGLGAFLLVRLGASDRLGVRVGEFLRTQSVSAPVAVRSLGLSLMTVGAWVAGVCFLAHGLGIAVPAVAFFQAVPLVALASFLPITVGGVGLREAGYVVLLAGFGVSPESCVALGLAQYTTLLGVALIGGTLFAVPESNRFA